MTVKPDHADMLSEFEPVAARCLDRHLSLAKDWMPHEYVPWSRGRDFSDLPWEPAQSKLSAIAQTAMEVNLLTEENLPSYHRELIWATGTEGAWGVWAHRWTAEEGRHSIAIRDLLLVSRGIDPSRLEQGRMHMVQHGWNAISAGKKGILRLLAYVSFQELATRISHRNLAKVADNPWAERLFIRVASDENLHMTFYRDVLGAAFELAPSAATCAVAAEVLGFEMPGTGIVDFADKAKAIAKAGIYDLRIHRDDVVLPLLKHWSFFERGALDADAEQAREQVAAFVAALDERARYYEAKRLAAAHGVGGAPLQGAP